MSSAPVDAAGADGPSAIGSDRLIGIQEVKAITGLADRAASELMSETGSAFCPVKAFLSTALFFPDRPPSIRRL